MVNLLLATVNFKPCSPNQSYYRHFECRSVAKISFSDNAVGNDKSSNSYKGFDVVNKREKEHDEGVIDHTGAQTMLYLTCSMISDVDLAYYGVSRAKDWVSVDCCTSLDVVQYL